MDINKIFSLLEKEYPDAKIKLDFGSAFELLVATILAAQCTDERVNIVTKELFKKYKTPKDYIDAGNEKLENDIKSTGFFKNKAKNIINCCTVLKDKYKNEVPQSMDELLELPGVGRKTANVILGMCYGKPAIIVDTHFIRLSNLIGFSKNKNPDKIELDTQKILEKDKWTMFSTLITTHGRKICIARRPKCPVCVISQYCEFYKTQTSTFTA